METRFSEEYSTVSFMFSWCSVALPSSSQQKVLATVSLIYYSIRDGELDSRKTWEASPDMAWQLKTPVKKSRVEERSEVTGYLKGKENGVNIRNKIVYVGFFRYFFVYCGVFNCSLSLKIEEVFGCRKSSRNSRNNYLMVNATKTQAMIIGSPNYDYEFSLNSVNIQIKDDLTLLGFLIDNKLSFAPYMRGYLLHKV